MYIRKGQLPILILNLAALVFFCAYFVARENYEFIIYIGVIAIFIGLIAVTNSKVFYPNSVLWGLTAWGILHMAGGSIFINGTRLYEIILIPMSKNYPILRYDQFVHIVGFGAATLTMYYVLKPLLRPELKEWKSLSIVVIMAGLGAGALNEIIEFLITVVVPETGVGGYVNTSLDLVSDLVGAILAMCFILFRRNAALLQKAGGQNAV